MNPYLRAHCLQYPSHEILDEIKFLYQSIMGGGHLVKDEKQSLKRIIEEMKPNTSMTIEIETISDVLCRVHFYSLSMVQARVLNRLFVYSANHFQGNLTQLKCVLEKLSCDKNEQQQAFIRRYLDSGMPMVSHSQTFKDHYKPSYRIVLRSLMKYFDLFVAIETCLDQDKRCLIGLDGRSGSGKSTLGQVIEELFNIPHVAMDDFFLPLAKRTKARLEEAGGNVDYERFIQEVKQPLLAQKDVTYRIFDCATMDFNGAKTFAYQNICLIEGSYAMHPKIIDMYDIKVFLTVSPMTQTQRILVRNGEKLYQRFKNEWIPMEENYFETYHIQEKADFVYDTDEDTIV